MASKDSFTGSSLEAYAKQLSNPAAPEGLHQTVRAQRGFAQGDPDFANSSLGRYANQQGLVAQSPSWFTGANTEGTNNGWSTEFTRKFIDGQDKAAEAGTLADYFSAPDATGVVTWDHTGSDGREFHFGDVYQDGKKVANLYDPADGGFDKDTANLMMSAWVLDGTQKARVLSDSDRMGALDRAITEAHETNNRDIPKAQQAAEFNARTQDRAEDFQKGGVDEAIVGGGVVGGAATGAAVGATLGSVIPGAGTLTGGALGGAIGGVVGGFGAFLNKDELTQQAARAYEITKLAHETEGTGAALATGLQQWAGFSTHLTSPLGNLEHGLVELTGDNQVGDAKSAFYGTDKHGESTRPAWAKPLSLGAAISDGLMQFVSPVNRAIYMTQMGASITGDVTSLAATGGKMFDPREGGFDNIFLDDNGRPDPVSATAGILKIGIDAVQVTGLGALARATRLSAAETKAGLRETEAAGFRFSFDEAGNVVGKKANYLRLLAPSEQVAAVSAARKARVAARNEGRTVTADDFYRAATALATGSNRLKVALVTGFGEGYEELAQGILEPIALDGKVSPGDLADSFLQGAAAGIGMGLGATAGGPTQDDRLKAQAYVLETLRRGGEEPDPAEWDQLWAKANPTRKRVMASRSKADVQATAQALDRVAESQAATLVATQVDAAKAIDARRSAVDRALRSDTIRTDAYHLMTGQLSAGRVSASGDPVGDTLPADAVEASALTIARLLEDRVRGMDVQAQTLRSRVSDPADPAQAADVQLLDDIELSRAVGASISRDVLAMIDRVYDESTSAEEAQQILGQLNGLLSGLYNRQLEVTVPEGAQAKTQDQLRLAAAKFVTLLHSREPKLDSGSYLTMLPQAAWDLTSNDSDNVLRVNVDVLASINGDFDGDKLRSEYQLILSDERFAQARAGQLLGGRGREVDIAERHFDAALAQAVGSALVGPAGPLRDEAVGTLANIETALSTRYGAVMSPAALGRVFEEFRDAVVSGDTGTQGAARVALVNALAREAGGAITELGRAELRNEWLWAAKVVRANFEAFQSAYVRARAAGSGPSATAPVADIDTEVGTNAAKAQAVSTAQTLSLFAVGNSLFRKFQKIHYSWYNSAVLKAAGAERADLFEMAAFYAELSRDVTRPELELVQANDTIGARVLVMLSRLVDDAMTDPDLAPFLNRDEALTVLANVKVKDVHWGPQGPEVEGGDISLVQLLLKRALEAEREEHAATFDTDEKLQAKHARLRSMTFPNTDGQVNAERAFLEVFGALPFGDSLGRVTGVLGVHTTPDQWLRNYISLDAEGRRDLERLYTNHPDYLDRAEKQNLPYAMDEAKRREVTPYRSMLDALLAVGRTELTFDPNAKDASKAFGGRRAEVAQRAAADFVEQHEAVTAALADFRKLTNRRTGDRVAKIQLVQDMFEANPVAGRLILEQIPDAAANAIFDDAGGQLYVARWVYEMFTIEDPAEALFFYWKNLTLAQWNATQAGGLDDRRFSRLNSRFQRLLYDLAREPGQMHLELLLRQMDTAKNLDEFFLWLNRTPGIRGQQAPLLPFHDDVADFEADAGGGWVTSRASSDLRAAITAARSAAEQLQVSMAARLDRAASDRPLRAAIRRALNGEPDGDYEALRQFEKAVSVSHELPRGFAPAAMLALTRSAMRGFSPHSTDKGITADAYVGLGEFQAVADAFGFVPGLERTMELLTAHSLGSLAGNLGDLGKHAGTAMDAHGRQIEWSRLSVEEALDMLDDPRTEQLALTLLTPQALDVVNGKLVERQLTDASLTDLLDASHYADLYNLDGDHALDNAMRYLSILDSRARAEGGHFDVQRYVNALAITRMSALDHPATAADRERISNQTVLDVARALQLVGRIQATPELRDGGALADLRAAAVEQLRGRRAAKSLPGLTDADSGLLVESWVQDMLTHLEADRLAQHQAEVAEHTGEELARRLAVIDAQFNANAERIRSLATDDLLGAVVSRFHLTGDATVDAAARAQIVEYAMSFTSADRMPESTLIWSKLASQRLAGRTPELSDTEWEQLSRSVMGVYLADQVLRVASHVTLPAFGPGDPAETVARFYKFFDPAYTFIATDLLTADSPVAAAATWLHTVAEQPRGPVSVDSMTATLRRTVLNDTLLGAWTPAQMSQITEDQLRMDSAAVAGAVAAAGNGPKRWAAVGFATRRTSQVPGADLLTTVAFDSTLLGDGADRFNEIAVTPAGHTEPTTMPLAQLDNRYVAAIRVNGAEVPLDADNLGFVWSGETTESGYRYVALDRLAPVVARLAAETGAPVSVEVDFFHPDSRPAEPEWANNVYFDGMAHSLLPDGSESLIAAFWSANGGQVAAATQKALDASKNGLPALERFTRLDEAAMAAAEEHWNVSGDMAAMLRAKTELLLAADDTLTTSDYNALYKMLQLAHIVVGTREGKPAAMTAAEVVAARAADPAAALPLEDAKLVKLSPDVLRTMLGETGDQGVNRFFSDEYLLNPDQVAEYTHVTDAMLARFPGWVAETGTPGDTSLVNVSAARTVAVRSTLSTAERSARSERVRFLNAEAARIEAARAVKVKKKDARNSLLTVLQLAVGSVETERNDFAFMADGIPIAPKGTGAEHSVRLLDPLRGVVDRGDYARGWRVVDEGGPSWPGGILTVESLDEGRELEHHLSKADIALVELNTFERPGHDLTQVQDRVEQALRFLTNTGVSIILGPGDGGGDLRYEAGEYLRDHGYRKVAGSKHLYAPVEFVDQTQNERATESTLTETRRILPARQTVTFLALDPIGTDENVAAVNPATRKLRDRKLVNNILPSATFAHYELPFEDNLDSGLYARTLTHLRTVTDPANAERRAELLAMGGTDPARMMPLADALDRFHARITDSSNLSPVDGQRLEVGDIIPFVHRDGKVILYRHGFELPKPEGLQELYDGTDMNVVLAASETEPGITANTGVIREIAPRAGYGRTLQLEVPLQLDGDKVQLAWNGMKYTLVRPGAELERFMGVPVFGNGVQADLFSDFASAASKEAFDGTVLNYRNALAFFQFDFTEDLVKFFYPDESTRPPQAATLVYSLLSNLASRSEFKIPLRDAALLAQAPVAIGNSVSEFAGALAATSGGPAADWTERLAFTDDASTGIARAVITYLLTEGADLDNVLKSAGFSHQAANTEAVSTRVVPGLFADLLNQGVTSPVHTELIRRFDAQLQRRADGAGYRLHPDWTVEIHDGTGASVRGYLQFGEAYSSGDNPLLNGQAYDPNEPGSVSAHNAQAAALSVGAITPFKGLRKAAAFARSFARGGGVTKPGASGESVWKMLTALPDEKDTARAGWRQETPAETVRRYLARQELVGFYTPLADDGWTTAQQQEYGDIAAEVLRELNLYGSQRAMVDTWVRMHLGRPSGRSDDGHELGVISGRDAVETVKAIRTNVSKRLLPTAGAQVPLLDVNHLTLIYLANLYREGGWSPRTTLSGPMKPARSWDAWVDVSFGTAWIAGDEATNPVPKPDFDLVYQLAVDGLMHGYQGATSSTRFLPVSADTLRQRQLMDDKTNKMLVSISADENLLATDPTLFNATEASLNEIIGGQRIYAPGRNGPDPASAQGQQLKRLDRWRRQTDAPRQVNTKMPDLRAAGQMFVGHTTKTTNYWRSIHNLRVGNVMLNPMLILSAPAEAFLRRSIDLFGDVVSGESVGAAGRFQSKAFEKISDTSLGAVAQYLGLTPTYTSEELAQVENLVAALSTRPEFKVMIFKELMHQYPSVPGIGKVEKWLESYAKFGARLQDPAWGMLPKDLARIYVKTALRRISTDPTGENVYSVPRLIASLSRNPEWLSTQDRETHDMAVAAIANIRSLKPNVISLWTRGIVEPLAEHDKFLRNTTGNMIKLLTTFQNFWANSFINITGMQGVADLVAFHLDGRKKTKLVRRFKAALAGAEFVPEAEEFNDMSEVIEGLDLADSIIRGGITHSLLFTFGMMAGGLGLGGEDDEEKWRRRAAELQGAGFVHDPREASNDFRNKGSVFLNWLPLGLDSLFKVNPDDPQSDAVAQMNWTMRYFASPILGFERFFRTGDFSEVFHGFADALGSHPIVNAQLWNEASQTVSELHAAANDAVEKGDHAQGAHLLITAVGVFEKMLFENSTVNMVYAGVDRYDRDPFKLPARNSIGDLRKDVRNNPYQTNEALTDFVDDNGTPNDPSDDTVKQQFVDRDAFGAQFRSLTENRFGLAFLGSLYTGLTGGGFTGSDMFRYNMPVKTRKIELAPQDQGQLEAFVLGAFQGAGGQVNLSETEAAQVIKNQAQAAGVRWNAAEVEKLAADWSAHSGLAELSRIDEAGREHLTDAGARAVFDGLRSGATTLGTAALNGVYMTKDQRDRIRDTLVKEITQEGVDLGLSKDQAIWRTRRIVFGTGTQADTPNLIDLLYTDQIPWTDTLEYNQLNTTYVTGPNGFPMATGFTRDGLLGALGLKPLLRPLRPSDTGMGVDGVMNSVDTVAGINTGLRGLEPRPASWEIPTVSDAIRKAAADVIDALKDIDFTPTAPYARSGGGFGGFSRRGGGGFGGRGGGGYYSDPYRLYALPGFRSPYGNSIPFINTSNPIIRRADVRRERVWSERGRLNQWQ